MSTKSYAVALCFLVVVLVGCKDTAIENHVLPPVDPFASLPRDTVVGSFTQIDSTISVSLWEFIDQSGRSVKLGFTSDRMYSAGHRIASHLNQSGSTINVELDSIIPPPEMASTISMPAAVGFDLGKLSNGRLSLNVTLNNRTIVAVALFSDTSIITKIQPNSFLWVPSPRLLRVPRNIIWGHAESILPATYFQLFLDSLVILGASSPNLMAGDYQYFKSNIDGSYELREVFSAPGKFFLYRFDPDTSVCRGLMKRFAKRCGDSLYVQLHGGRGENYNTSDLRWEE